jgi:hypothetical protein
MSKGLCAGDKSWLGKITGIGDKITSIMQKAKSVASQMFTGSAASALNDTQKMVRFRTRESRCSKKEIPF